MSDINKYTIPEEYKETIETGLITAITQKSAGISKVAKQVSCNGAYHEMGTVGTLTIGERTKRHEEKPQGQEPMLGNRRFYPNMFAGLAWMSEDDFTLKGRLPIILNTLHDALSEAAEPLPDRVLLGVTDPSEAHGGNCLIASAATGTQGVKSPYGGRRQGLMGINWTGLDGTEEEVLPQQPFIKGALATSYTQYSSSLDGLDYRKTNVLPINFSTDGTNTETDITEAKLRRIRTILAMKNIVTGMGEFCMAVTPLQMEKMMSAEHFVNALYRNSLHAQEDGTYLSSMLGIRFLVTPDVPIVNIGTSGDQKWVRANPVWRASSVEFGTWATPKYKFREVNSNWDTLEVSVQFAYGAGRRRLEDVLTVHNFDETLAGLSV